MINIDSLEEIFKDLYRNLPDIVNSIELCLVQSIFENVPFENYEKKGEIIAAGNIIRIAYSIRKNGIHIGKNEDYIGNIQTTYPFDGTKVSADSIYKIDFKENIRKKFIRKLGYSHIPISLFEITDKTYHNLLEVFVKSITYSKKNAAKI